MAEEFYVVIKPGGWGVVHSTVCGHLHRASEPLPWRPSDTDPQDRACVSCLGGVLPTELRSALVQSPAAGADQ